MMEGRVGPQKWGHLEARGVILFFLRVGSEHTAPSDLPWWGSGDGEKGVPRTPPNILASLTLSTNNKDGFLSLCLESRIRREKGGFSETKRPSEWGRLWGYVAGVYYRGDRRSDGVWRDGHAV